MIAFLAGISARVWGYAAVAALAAAILVGAYFQGQSSAEAEARTSALEADIKNRRTRDEVDRSTAATPDPAAELLRDWRRRD